MSVYDRDNTTALKEIWNSLGTFWAEFENKEIIEAFWSGILSAARFLQKDLYYLSLSKTLSTLPPIIISEHDYYTLTFSGTNQNAFMISGYYNFTPPEYTYHISGLSEIIYSGVTNTTSGQVLVSGVDYDFNLDSDYRIRFLYIPSGTASRKIYIPYSKKINPVLTDVYGQMIGYDDYLWKQNYYSSYVRGYGQTSGNITEITDINSVEYKDWNVRNHKYFIWALSYLKRQQYTITNLKKSIGISTGLPFSWYSGIITTVGSNYIDIDHGDQFAYKYLRYYDHVLNSGGLTDQTLNTYSAGDSIGQFDLLSSGIEIYDYINNSGLILNSGLVDEHYQKMSTIGVIIQSGIL